ncbi:MAG: hypothetical protein IJ343_13420 [Clostridia bacterium]|nr:hypothetical protein [Clostridia bacterium]
MAQDFQRQPRNTQAGDVDQSILVEALSDALIKATQKNQTPYRPEQDDNEEGDTSVDLAELFFYVLGKIHFVLLAALLGTLLAGAYAFYMLVPQYQATAKLYILNQTGLSVSMADLQVASNLTLDYQEVFKTWEVHEMVRSELNLDYSYKDMQRMLTVTNPNDTRLLYISVKHEDPEMAMEIANAYARAAKTFIYQVMEGDEPNEFSIALVPSEAVGMGRIRYLVLGFVGGAALVLAVLVLMFLLDDRPHTPDDITKMAGIPTLAIVPREQNIAKAKKRRVSQTRKEGKK